MPRTEFDASRLVRLRPRPTLEACLRVIGSRPTPRSVATRRACSKGGPGRTPSRREAQLFHFPSRRRGVRAPRPNARDSDGASRWDRARRRLARGVATQPDCSRIPQPDCSRIPGHRPLPALSLGCSGFDVVAPESHCHAARGARAGPVVLGILRPDRDCRPRASRSAILVGQPTRGRA
jgi:hypothetical protein